MSKFICVHGHFYQPPRENPWLELIEYQDSAYPYHDWNERISAECYEPNTASRIIDSSGKIKEMVNNYSKMSFNFGPTLLSWMEKYNNHTYQKILESDKLSQEHFSGHGSALAQVYNHIIMPLANRKDKETQVIWGKEDFKSRFGRDPEGMWLAETAVDTETLEVLAEQGIKFTILAPRQAKAYKSIEDDEWIDVSDASVDPTTPYLCNLPSGKQIVLFFYDGPVSQKIAFGGLLNSGEFFANELTNAFDDDREHNQMVHIATDGESYGHHHKNGDMALAYCLNYITENNLASITNYGEFLANNPPVYEAQIIDNSSWSCGHGVERWRDNCGCNSGREGWNQLWRKPLRESLDKLRDDSSIIYEKLMKKYHKSPWDIRNRYIDVVLNRSMENIEKFFAENFKADLSQSDKTTILKLLEMQRNALLMYTSCGWFFDEISGIETVQVIQYAAKVIQYVFDLSNKDLESDFLEILKTAPSNVHKDTLYIYNNYVKPTKLDLERVSADCAIASLFEDYSEQVKVGCFNAIKSEYLKKEAGKNKLATGILKVFSEITLEEEEFIFAVTHLGDTNIKGGIKKLDNSLNQIQDELNNVFEIGDITQVLSLIDQYFDNTFTLWDIFRDEQRKVLDQILESNYANVEASYRQIYNDNYSTMSFLKHLNIQIPEAIYMSAQHVLTLEMNNMLRSDNINIQQLDKTIDDINKWGVSINQSALTYLADKLLSKLLSEFSDQLNDIESLKYIENILSSISRLQISKNFRKSQDIYFRINKDSIEEINEKINSEDQENQDWSRLFNNVGEYLRIDLN